MTARTRTPFSYYGSKGYTAHRIASILGPHRAYVEPFAGSAAVLLAKDPARYEVLNDLDGDVINFFRVLRDNADDLLSRLRLTPYGREEYFTARDAAPTTDPVERARRFYATASASFSGARTGGYSAGHPTKGSKPATFVRRVDEFLPVISERLRRVEIENTDARTVLARWSHPDAVAYLDPPYLGDTRTGAGQYVVDAPAEEFHASLLDSVDAFQGRVILSGYASALYDSHLTPAGGWERIEWDRFAGSASTGASSVRRRTEVLWVRDARSSDTRTGRVCGTGHELAQPVLDFGGAA